MITLEHYAGKWSKHKDWTFTRMSQAIVSLDVFSRLEQRMIDAGVEFPDNPTTKSGVSGTTFGGFRPQDCPIGAPDSSHKKGGAVDRYDPKGGIDRWLMANPSVLKEFGVYIEHPDKTPGWSHWSTIPPKSGRHIFYP